MNTENFCCRRVAKYLKGGIPAKAGMQRIKTITFSRFGEGSGQGQKSIMLQPLRRKALTLTEIIVAVVILFLLGAIGTSFYIKSQRTVRDNLAKSMLQLIAQSQEVRFAETSAYTSCNDTSECNRKLMLAVPLEYWDYKVTLGGGFCAQAHSKPNNPPDRYWHSNNGDVENNIPPAAGACP